MSQLLRTTTSPRSLLLILVALHLGCGGDSGGGREPSKESKCEALLLATSEAEPLDEIIVEGIPEDFGELLAAKVTAAEVAEAEVAEAEESSLAVVTREEDGTIVLSGPIHPTGSVEGGEVTLALIDSEGRSCPPIPFTILPLPPAPGATEEMLEHLEAILQGQAAYFQTSVAALRDMELGEVSEEHFSLFLAQHGFNEVENPNSLRALLDGTAPILEGGEINVDLTDRLLAKVGFPQMLRESAQELETLLEDVQAQELLFAPGTQRFGLLPPPATANQLHLEMEMAQWGNGYVQEGGLKRTVGGIAKGVGALGLVPHPGTKTASMLLGGGLFTFLKATEAAAKLLPSSFVSIDFELTKPTFTDDDPGTGEWENVKVVATSQGMSMDQLILESILELAKFGDGVAAWGKEFIPDTVKEMLLNVVLDATVAEAIGSSTGLGEEGFIHIPAQQTPAIDITEEPWSFAELQGSLEPVDRQGYKLKWEGTLQGAVRVGTGLGMFGGQHIFKTQSVSITPLSIVVTPPYANLDPREEEEFAVEVVNAHDDSIEMTILAGEGSLEKKEGSYTVSYTAPFAEELFPDRITFTSESTTGFYADSAYPGARTEVPIYSKDPFILIDPPEACLEPGERLTFTASVIGGKEDAQVRWEASAGSINSSGRFTAPTRDGDVEITATLDDDEEVTATAYVKVGRCTGDWNLNLGGGAGHFMGDDAGVAHRLVDGSIYAMSFSLPRDIYYDRHRICISFPFGIEAGDSGTYVGWVLGSVGSQTPAFSSFEGEGITLEIDRLVAKEVQDGTVMTYEIEGSASGQVRAGSINGEFYNEPFPVISFDLSFKSPAAVREGWTSCPDPAYAETLPPYEGPGGE